MLEKAVECASVDVWQLTHKTLELDQLSIVNTRAYDTHTRTHARAHTSSKSQMQAK